MAISAALLLEELAGFSFDTSVLFNGLNCASFLGIVEIVAALIERMVYVNEGCIWERTPLSWAAEKSMERW